MKDLFLECDELVKNHLVDLFGTLDLSAVNCEPPKEEKHGDVACNAALVLAKQLKKPPIEIAGLLAERLEEKEGQMIKAIDIAGAGFINLHLQDDFLWTHIANKTFSHFRQLGQDKTNEANNRKINIEKINVEYVSANPTGPIHIGHARGAVVGDVLCNLLQAVGYDVVREYYINDAGAQIRSLAHSALLRARQEAGEAVAISEGFYPGRYLIPIGKKLYKEEELHKENGEKLFRKPLEEQIAVAKAFVVPALMEMIKKDLHALGVFHNVFSSEQKLHDEGVLEESLEILKPYIYEGTLPAPKNTKPEDWEKHSQTIFRSKTFGDDQDRVVKRYNGEPTYFAGDIAYSYDKYKRGFIKQVIVWGADHAGYVKRVQAATKAVSNNRAHLVALLCQLVKLSRKGKAINMSKRAGSFVELREVLDEVGRDALRFWLLTRKSDMVLEFDFDLVKAQNKDNPVFYVQYAYARIHSVLRQYKKTFPKLADQELSLTGKQLAKQLATPAERQLALRLAHYPRHIDSAYRAYAPHRLTDFLQKLAGDFHKLWAQGNKNPRLKFILPDNLRQTQARICLISGVRLVLKKGFDMIGISAPEEM